MASAIWLVGGTNENFKTSKLPSHREVLSVLINFHDWQNLTLKDSMSKTTDLLLLIWMIG